MSSDLERWIWVFKGHFSGAYGSEEGILVHHQGNTTTEWSPDAKQWLQFVLKRIRSSGNHTDVTFLCALVVSCAIWGNNTTWGHKSIKSGRCSTGAIRRHFFFQDSSQLCTSTRECCYWTLMRYFLWIPSFAPFCFRQVLFLRVRRETRSRLVGARRPQVLMTRTPLCGT